MMQIVRIYFGYWLLVIFINHAYISHVICICIRIAAAAEEVVYEVVAEPQEPQWQARSRRIVGSRPKAPLILVLSSRRKASPSAHPCISNYDTIFMFLLLVH